MFCYIFLCFSGGRDDRLRPDGMQRKGSLEKGIISAVCTETFLTDRTFSIFTCEPTSPEEERRVLNYFCLSSVLELPSCGSIWAHSKMSLCEQVKKVTVCPEDCKIPFSFMEKHSVNIVSHDMSPTLTWPSTPRMKSIKKVKITINLESCSEANGDLDEVSHLWTNKTMSHTTFKLQTLL